MWAWRRNVWTNGSLKFRPKLFLLPNRKMMISYWSTLWVSNDVKMKRCGQSVLWLLVLSSKNFPNVDRSGERWWWFPLFFGNWRHSTVHPGGGEIYPQMMRRVRPHSRGASLIITMLLQCYTCVRNDAPLPYFSYLRELAKSYLVVTQYRSNFILNCVKFS